MRWEEEDAQICAYVLRRNIDNDVDFDAQFFRATPGYKENELGPQARDELRSCLSHGDHSSFFCEGHKNSNFKERVCLPCQPQEVPEPEVENHVSGKQFPASMSNTSSSNPTNVWEGFWEEFDAIFDEGIQPSNQVLSPPSLGTARIVHRNLLDSAPAQVESIASPDIQAEWEEFYIGDVKFPSPPGLELNHSLPLTGTSTSNVVAHIGGAGGASSPRRRARDGSPAAASEAPASPICWRSLNGRSRGVPRSASSLWQRPAMNWITWA